MIEVEAGIARIGVEWLWPIIVSGAAIGIIRGLVRRAL